MFSPSCADDKGNYDYTPVNIVTIGGLEEVYYVPLRGSLSIFPDLDNSIANDESNYSFKWMYYENLSDGTKVLDTFAETKNIDIPQLQLLPGEYCMYLVITDKTTGIEFRSQVVTISIANDIGKGIMMLCNESDQTVLYHLNETKQTGSTFVDLTLRDVMLAQAGLEDMGKPGKVICYGDNNSPFMGALSADGRYAVSVLTEKMIFRLHPYTLEYKPLYNLLNNIVQAPNTFLLKDIILNVSFSSNTNIAVTANDNLMFYTATGSPSFWTYNIYMNTMPDMSRFSVSDKLVYYDTFNGILLFNKDTKSFVKAKFSAGTSTVSEYGSDKETLFLYNNTGREPLFMHGRVNEGGVSGLQTYAVMKDASNNIIFSCFDFKTDVQAFDRNLTTMSVLNIDNAVEFAMSHGNNTTTNQLLYYRTDTEVYVYNMVDNTSKKVYTAPLNHKISLMQFYMNSTLCTWQNKLVVYTYDTTAPANSCGKMEMFSCELNGDMTPFVYNGLPVIYDGFGKVISASYKTK